VVNPISRNGISPLFHIGTVAYCIAKGNHFVSYFIALATLSLCASNHWLKISET